MARTTTATASPTRAWARAAQPAGARAAIVGGLALACLVLTPPATGLAGGCQTYETDFGTEIRLCQSRLPGVAPAGVQLAISVTNQGCPASKPFRCADRSSQCTDNPPLFCDNGAVVCEGEVYVKFVARSPRETLVDMLERAKACCAKLLKACR